MKQTITDIFRMDAFCDDDPILSDDRERVPPPPTEDFTIRNGSTPQTVAAAEAYLDTVTDPLQRRMVYALYLDTDVDCSRRQFPGVSAQEWRMRVQQIRRGILHHYLDAMLSASN